MGATWRGSECVLVPSMAKYKNNIYMLTKIVKKAFWSLHTHLLWNRSRGCQNVKYEKHSSHCENALKCKHNWFY